MRHHTELGMRLEIRKIDKMNTSDGKFQKVLSCLSSWQCMKIRSCPRCGLRRKLGRRLVFVMLCAVHDLKFYIGSDFEVPTAVLKLKLLR